MSFRFWLCLEGVPAYSHTPFVAERIITRRCSFDRLDDDSALLSSARSLNCWAWTANPSSIPKVVWLTFTSRGNGLAGEVLVNDVRPTGAKRGATFRVFVHLDKMEDYSMAPLEFFGSCSDASAFKPTPISFTWHFLTVDGMPPEPVIAEDDGEAAARAAALARRGRRGPHDEHPRLQFRRRDGRDDDHDKDDTREGCRDAAGRWDPQGTVRRERTRSPRRCDQAGSSHRRRREAGPQEMDIDAFMHAMAGQEQGGLALPAEELRSLLAEQALILKRELLECVSDIVKPVMEDSAQLRRWLSRATDLLRAAAVPEPGSSPASWRSPRLLLGDASPFGGGVLVNTVAGQEAQPLSVDSKEMTMAGIDVEGTEEVVSQAGTDEAAKFLSQLSLESRDEAWHETAVSPPRSLLSLPAQAPSGTLPCQASAPALLSTPTTPTKKNAPLPVTSPRRSGRIAIKKKARQLSDGVEAIQEIIARACGILAPSAAFDDASRVAFSQLFLNGPLASSAIQALEALVKQVKKIKKKAACKTATAAPAMSPAPVDV